MLSLHTLEAIFIYAKETKKAARRMSGEVELSTVDRYESVTD